MSAGVDVVAREGPGHHEHRLAVDVADREAAVGQLGVELQGELEVPRVGRAADREDREQPLAVPALVDLEVDLLEPVVRQLEEDPEVVAAPLDEAVEPLDALADQALGVAELGDRPPARSSASSSADS